MNDGSSGSNREEDVDYTDNENINHDEYLVKAMVAATARSRNRRYQPTNFLFVPAFKRDNVPLVLLSVADGTHIPCVPRHENADAWINRKGFHSQNVLAVCSFDMKFTYMLAGYEGSCHDARMLEEAIAFHGFPLPPPGGNVDVNADYVLDDEIDDTGPSIGTQPHESSRERCYS
ncbi:hypothetical protein TIFTF001_028570 [Ficus carica]|uniref:DDE Tnp4 domain-containing protein n=1 Tax=Ficus carica TaxID=3494 RepID=A0AA88DQA6_FICCA|nr:hypothetical protein TIFTF001_028570 [Ficus carica]